MPERSSKKRPRDANQLAKAIVDEEEETPDKPEKNQAAVELGRLGGLKGGKARANKLTSERRREIAQRAARARWGKGQSDSGS